MGKQVVFVCDVYEDENGVEEDIDSLINYIYRQLKHSDVTLEFDSIREEKE